MTMPSPPITASQSQGHVEPVAAVDEHMLRHLGQRAAPRAPAPRARRAGYCRDRSAPATQRRPQRTRSRRSPRTVPRDARRSAAWNRRCPLGIRFGIEHDGGGHHRTRQRTAPGLVAAGHRPDAALDQRALAAKARRRDRDHALDGRACSLPAFLSIFLADLSRIMAGIVRKRAAGRNRKPGTIPVIQRVVVATPRPQSHKRPDFRAWGPQLSPDGAFRVSLAHEWTVHFADRPARATCRI